MSNEVIYNIIKNKDYIIRPFLFKIIKENNLDINETLLLIYLTNQEHPELDLNLINQITSLDRNEIMASFSSLTAKGLISTNISKDGDRVSEEISLDGIYKLAMKGAGLIKHVLPTRMLYKIFAGIIIPAKWHKKSRDIFLRESKNMKRKNFLSWMEYISISTNPKKILDKLKALGIKILFVSGDHDVCFVKSVKKMAAYIDNAKLNIINACGHVCTIEKYKEFNNLALSYLKSIHMPKIVLSM